MHSVRGKGTRSHIISPGWNGIGIEFGEKELIFGREKKEERSDQCGKMEGIRKGSAGAVSFLRDDSVINFLLVEGEREPFPL